MTQNPRKWKWLECAAPAALLLMVGGMSAAADVCAPPGDLWRTVETRFAGVRVARLSDLVPFHQTMFVREHPGRCPGMTRVDFFGDGSPTYALVLLSGKGRDSRSRLVVAHRTKNEWDLVTLDEEGEAVVTPVVWSEGAGAYSGLYERKRLEAQYPVVIFCGYESWAILYAWTNGGVAKIWLTD